MTAAETEKGNTADDGRLRINRYLAKCGLGARRKCEELVVAGHIYLNGEKVTKLATMVDPMADKVEYKGNLLQPVRLLEYLAYHKPVGPVVTQQDPEGRPTVYEAMQRATGRDLTHLKYVGRLDINSEGLLIFTNDGDLVHGLTHPRYHVKKVYHVRIDRQLDGADATRMVAEGVVSGEDELRAGRVALAAPGTVPPGKYWYEVDLYEGKNRQIRRMFEGLGYKVQRLVRIQFACVKIGSLSSGGIRPLTDREVAGLKAIGYRPSK